MFWKRSVIKDFSYKFPAELMTLTLQKESVKIEAGHGARCLQEAFDPEFTVDYEEAIIGQEIIYTLDKDGVLLDFFPTKNWAGPDIEPETEVEWEPPSPVDKLLERISEINPEALYPTNMKNAVIGRVERFGMQPLILLDREKCIEILMDDGMDEDEAEEFFEYNTIGAWMGEGTPCFATIEKNLF